MISLLPFTSVLDSLTLHVDRYDVEGRGSLAVGDFLEKLGLDGWEVESQSQKLNQTVSQLDLPLLTDTASLEHVR